MWQDSGEIGLPLPLLPLLDDGDDGAAADDDDGCYDWWWLVRLLLLLTDAFSLVLINFDLLATFAAYCRPIVVNIAVAFSTYLPAIDCDR